MSKQKADTGAVNFRALQLSNEHRSAYGLRYNDLNRYRNHCANRTHRLRSSLKMNHGKGREFKKLPQLTTDSIRDGHLQLLLFESERAWAYSQELLANAALPANEAKAGKIRHSATGRFRRSIHWCTQLLSHCQALYEAKRLSAGNMIEATVYTLIMSGRLLRHKDEFEDAMDQLCVARSLLDELVKCANSSRDQALATMFADEISPEIRHCSHQLGHANSYDVDAIVNAVAPKQIPSLVAGHEQLIKSLHAQSQTHSHDARNRLQPLIWEGKEVPVRSPELVDVLLHVQAAEARLHGKDNSPAVDAREPEKGNLSKVNRSRKGVAAYDGILAALSDAEGVARKLVEAQQATGSSSTTSRSGTRDIHFVYSYLVFQLLSKRIERDLALIDALVNAPSHASSTKISAKQQTSTPKTDARVNPAVVKLLETVLQSLDHMRTLSIVDESPDLANAVDARLAHAKSRKCIFLARAYSAVKQYAQALSLSRKAMLHLRECASLSGTGVDPINASTPSFYPVAREDISHLETLRVTDETEFKHEWFMFNGGAVSAERDSNKKPLFFDIALNYVQLDMDRLQERAGNIAPPPAVKNVVKAFNEGEQSKTAVVSRAKAEEIERSATPEPSAPAVGGLSNLLGGWWGRK